jgi:hypothetical protein
MAIAVERRLDEAEAPSAGLAATVKALAHRSHIHEFEMSRPNVDDAIEKAKKVRRLDGMP